MCSAPGHTWVPAALGMWLKITPKKRRTFLGLKPSGWQWAFSPCAPARASKKPRARGPAGTAPPHLPSGWILSPTALLHTQLIALRAQLAIAATGRVCHLSVLTLVPGRAPRAVKPPTPPIHLVVEFTANLEPYYAFNIRAAVILKCPTLNFQSQLAEYSWRGQIPQVSLSMPVKSELTAPGEALPQVRRCPMEQTTFRNSQSELNRGPFLVKDQWLVMTSRVNRSCVFISKIIKKTADAPVLASFLPAVQHQLEGVGCSQNYSIELEITFIDPVIPNPINLRPPACAFLVISYLAISC